MSVDLYAHCPCGSGKKIKFCKCKESVSELDRVLKMIDGGQIVPALDRLANILTEHPDAAWALAIRGRLLLELRELQSLADNADRFIRLQPSNPLALTQRAAAQLFSADIKVATDSMLEALSETGREVDSFVLDVSSAVAASLAQQGIYLTARVYASLSMMAPGYEGENMAASLLEHLNSSRGLNQLMKSLPSSIPRPATADWGERYDEAAMLLRSNKVLLAESKLQSLSRTVPNEPAVLSGLLTCAIWRADVAGQSSLCRKLSACESLDFETRVDYRALSCLVNPADTELASEAFQLTTDIDNAEQVEIALTAHSRLLQLPAEVVSQLLKSDNVNEVPPRAAFQILDRDPPQSLASLPPADAIPESIGFVLVFGRQTDRAARIEVIDISGSYLEQIKGVIHEALGDQIQLNQQPSEPLPLLNACLPNVAWLRFKADPNEAADLQQELVEKRIPRSIVSTKLSILGSASLAETAEDASKLLERSVVIRVLEQYDTIVAKSENVISEVCQLAKIEPPSTMVLKDSDIESVANTDLNRIDPSELGFEACLYLLQRAQQISATPAIRHFAMRLIDSPLPEEMKLAKLFAYSALIGISQNGLQAITLLEQAKAYAEQNQLPIIDLLMVEVGLRLQIGDGEGFQRTFRKISTEYSNRPEVMAQLQQLLISHGLLRPDGSPRQMPADPRMGAAPAPAESSGGGIWTPENPNAEPSTPESSDGSKLWIPGMD